MAETVTAWPYQVSDTRTEDPQSEPVRVSEHAPPSSIVVRSGDLVTIASWVANSDVMALVNALRAGTIWSVGGETLRFAGDVSIREARPHYSAVTARFHRI